MSTIGPSTRVALTPPATCGSSARAALRELLAHAGAGPEARETAALLATELVTNAVEHGGGTPYLDATIETGVLRLEVTDGSPDLPQPSDPGEFAERGRGLLLIAALAARWGADRRTDGKTVWCEVELA